MSPHRTKTYLAMALKNFAASLAEKGLSPLDESVKVEYLPGAESNLSCQVKITDGDDLPRFFELRVREFT